MTIPPVKTPLFKSSLTRAVILPMALLVVLTGVLFWQISQLLANNQWINRTDEIISHANEAQKLLIDLETGYRGYLLTNADDFLDPYEKSEPLVKPSLDELRQRVQYSPLQVHRVDELQAEAMLWIRYSRVGLAIKRGGGNPAPLMLKRNGKRRMDRMRALISQIIETESLQKDQRDRIAQRSTSLVMMTVWSLILVLGPVLAFFIRNQLMRVTQTYEDALKKREAMQQSLRVSEEKYRSIVETANEGICTFDPEGRIAYVNQRMADLLGYPPEEMIHRPLSDFIPKGITQNPTVTHNSSGDPQGQYEQFFSSKAGKALCTLAHLSPIVNDDGEFTGTLGMFTDITERKQLEEEVRKYARELEEADRQKDQFLAFLGHELKTPLGAMKNSLYLLTRNAPAEPAQKRYYDVLDRQIQQITRLIGDLHDISRVKRGKLDLKKKRIDLIAVVRQALEATKSQMEERQQQVSVSLPAEPFWIEGDSERLMQVFNNLLGNAAKYTDSGGTIEIAGCLNGRDIIVAIHDSGIGLPPEELEAIFDLYHQLERDEQRSQGGMGIGLALVRGLVREHGGEVWASSDGPGKGSVFTVRLPGAEQEANTG